VPLQHSGEKALGGGQIAPLSEPELQRASVAVDRAVKIHPTAADLDIGFVDVPLASDCSLTVIEPLQQLGGVANNSAMHCRMVNGDAALSHHLPKIPQAQIVSQIPLKAEQDHGSIELPALEHCFLPHRGTYAVAETLKQKFATCVDAPCDARRTFRIGTARGQGRHVCGL
jgi:hypothetical protein